MLRFLRKAARAMVFSPRMAMTEGAMRVRRALDFERRWGAGYALPPYSVSFWLTRRCNLSCRMCWVDKTPALDAGDPLTFEEYCRVIAEIAPVRPRITFTGGEPLLNRNCLPLIKYAKSKGLRISLNTNGLLLSQFAGELVEAGLDDISVSIDGPEAIHDAIRGKDGSFDAAVQGLQDIISARRIMRGPKTIVRINFTITGSNVNSMKDIYALGCELGVDCVSFQHPWFLTKETVERHNRVFMERFGQTSPNLDGFACVEPGIDPSNGVNELIVKIGEMRETGTCNKYMSPIPAYPKRRGTDLYFYPDLDEGETLRYYRQPEAPIRTVCRSRWWRLDVDPEGNVTPCLSYIAGNVRDAPLLKIWNNEKYKRFRRELSLAGYFPGCVRCCGLFSD